MQHSSIQAWNPYGDGDPPLSVGRFLLSEMMAEYCEVQWGITPAQTLRAIEDPVAEDEDGSIRSTIGFLWSMLVAGEIGTFVRPFGGGEPQPFPASRWEIDAAVARFATSAVDPDAWTDAGAPPTHWIFVDRADFDAFMTGWCYPEPDEADAGWSALAMATPVPLSDAESSVRELVAPARISEMRPRPRAVAPRSVIRLPEVKARSGLSRSQIYKQMDAGTFPLAIELGARMVGWYEDEVDGWTTDLRRRTAP